MSKEIRAAPAAGSAAGHCNFEQFGVRLERSSFLVIFPLRPKISRRITRTICAL